MLSNLLNTRIFFWGLLALPAIPMVVALAGGEPAPDGRPITEALLHPTGEFAARFMILAMAISPLRMLFPQARWPLWLMRRRRYLGVAAFAYALAHTGLYVVDMGALRLILAEITTLGIWTGWVALPCSYCLPQPATTRLNVPCSPGGNRCNGLSTRRRF